MALHIGGWSNRQTFFLERFYDLPTQLLLISVIRKGDLVVDVGANEGMISLLASFLVGDGGKVIAFEPNPAARRRLAANVEMNSIRNVSIRSEGLADRSSELTLSVPAINSGEASFTFIDAPGEQVVCTVVRGDDALSGLDPSFIKVDVEGFEARVIDGLKQTLRRSKPILSMELVTAHLARDNEKPALIAQTLTALGYRGYRLLVRGKTHHKRLSLDEISIPWLDGDYVWIHSQDERAGDLGMLIEADTKGNAIGSGGTTS